MDQILVIIQVSGVISDSMAAVSLPFSSSFTQVLHFEKEIESEIRAFTGMVQIVVAIEMKCRHEYYYEDSTLSIITRRSMVEYMSALSSLIRIYTTSTGRIWKGFWALQTLQEPKPSKPHRHLTHSMRSPILISIPKP